MTYPLAGRVVIVTGAGRGIGRAVALECARQGAAVVVNNRSPEPGEAVAREIEALGGAAIAHPGDVADSAVAKALIGVAVARFGRLDGLVNNAGIVRDRMLVNMSEEEWDEAVRVNLRGTFLPLQAAARHWRELAKAGPVSASIVNTTSAAGLYHNLGQSNYGAAKAGVTNLTVTASAELARYGIRVNAVAPAAATRMSEHLIPAENRRIGTFDRYEPATIAPAVAWLVSEASHGVTGRIYDLRGDRIYVAQGWHRGPTIETSEPWTLERLGDRMLQLHRDALGNAAMDGLPVMPPG